MVQPTTGFIVQSSLVFPSRLSSSESNSPLVQAFLSPQDDPPAPLIVDGISRGGSSTPGQIISTMFSFVCGKNVNLFWIATSCLAVWFLFWHTPIFWKQRQVIQIRDALLAVHIVGAGTIYMACVHNCLVTPSLSSTAKFSHTWIGRLGLVSGVVSFVLGAYLAWSRLTSDPTTVGGTTLGFAIPITIGGLLQILSEVKGFRAIREYKRIRQQLEATTSLTDMKELEEKKYAAICTHIGWMVSLFVMACSVPAGMRLASTIAGREDGVLATVLIFSIIFVLSAIATRYVEHMMPKSPKGQDDEYMGLGQPTPPPPYGAVSDS
ncbi:expressed unknown protein [Seminavis robusta]|uniref:Uncharacterized protein n=1 Tax=Seminavis robusta TaxID=568900 RepID=A0A9N8H8Z2_9STRA|nr:expressed unknown protein [Seminavis robusta]|eukprot:Sro103_g052420.1 n/a (322) ;mRNA; f:38172-39137